MFLKVEEKSTNVSLCEKIGYIRSRLNISYKYLRCPLDASTNHSIRMIVTELRLINLVLVLFLFTTPSILVDAAAGRCYLCSQNTLAECAGDTQSDSPFFTPIMQYYTEPCNGQCVLFRNEKTSTIRGCSWTYGHMTPKSTGWHELSPGIQAYFCDSYLCNNGTVERPEIPLIRTGIVHDEIIRIPLITRRTTTTTISPQQLFILSGNTFPIMQTGESYPLTRIALLI